MTTQQQLQSAGFIKLPAFDPDYFKFRGKIGFLLLLNEKHNLSYHVFTINAYSCLSSAWKLVTGEQADRARDLQEAMRKSVPENWDVYFRPNGLYPGLRHHVRNLIQDYKTLNTYKPRIDQDEASWGYQVHHAPTRRSFAVVSNQELTDYEAISQFLRAWRKSLDHGVNRKSITLAMYYAGSNQLATATKEWINRNLDNFSIVDIPQLAGKARHEVVSFTSTENRRHTNEHRKTLTA